MEKEKVEEIEGERIILTRYTKEQVPKYNAWMKDEYLQEMTASEPLELEEEYELQRDWERDPKKWIFIILEKTSVSAEEARADRIEHMIGDVNLFLHDYLPPGQAELLVMIAEPRFRCKGFASEAIRLMMEFGRVHFLISRFIVRISSKNVPSIRLFEKLGFKQFEFVEAFDEVGLEFFCS